MTRRSIRENIFLIVFKAEFNNQEEMEEQIRYSISKSLWRFFLFPDNVVSPLFQIYNTLYCNIISVQ